MSSAACSPPFFSCAPNEAFGPVIGPPMPSLICAWAPPETARPRPSARPANSLLFIKQVSPHCFDRGARLGVPATSGRTHALFGDESHPAFAAARDGFRSPTRARWGPQLLVHLSQSEFIMGATTWTFQRARVSTDEYRL